MKMNRRHFWRVPSGKLISAVMTCGILMTARAQNEESIPSIPLWYKTVDLRGSFGFKDNVLLNNTNPKSSAFWASGLEMLVFRLPTAGWQVNFFLTGENVRYFESVGVEDEQSLIAVLQVGKDLGHQWKSSFLAQYIYQNQVLDVSATETVTAIAKLQLHAVGGRWALRRDFQKNWVELEMSGTRQFVAEPLDDSWQFGPRLSLGRSYGHKSDVTLSYQRNLMPFDTRTQVDRMGMPVPGTELEFTTQILELSLKHNWDAKRRWRATARLGWEVNEDNGSGFFDFNLYRASQKLAYRAEKWELSGQARIAYYDFPVQTVSATDLRKRNKTVLSFTLHAERNLTKKMKLFTDYSHERSQSNALFDRYTANVIRSGIDWQF